MMILNTWYWGCEGDEHVFGYCTGKKTRGLISVPRATGVPAYIAELYAIKHLLFERRIFNVDFVNPAGYQLCISCELAGELSKPGLSKPLKPFKSLLALIDGVSITSVTQPYISVPLPDDPDVTKLKIVPESPHQPLLAQSVIGPIAITQHAVDQFVANYHGDNVAESKLKPIIQLKRRLESKSLHIEELPENIKNHKQKKYLVDSLPVILGNPTSQMHYLTIQNPADTYRTLVTVYRRHPEFNENTFTAPVFPHD